MGKKFDELLNTSASSQKKESQQIMELLLALWEGRKADQAKSDADRKSDQEQMNANNKTMLATINANQAKMQERMEAYTKADKEEMLQK
jgi:hypothetical protein